MSKRLKAIFPFSADPITIGHIDIIQRANKIFNLTIGVGNSPEKNYLLDIETRIKLVEHHLKMVEGLGHLPVIAYDNSFTDFAYSQDINILVKGLRNATDMEYEQKLFNFGFEREFEKIFLLCKPELAQVSSSYVKNIVKGQENPIRYVMMETKAALEKAILGQTIIGVTGEVGSGKSHICKRIVNLNTRLDVHHLNLDNEVKKVYTCRSPRSNKIRKLIFWEFPEVVSDSIVDLKGLANIVFNDESKLKALNVILKDEVDFRIREFCRGKKGIILLESALIAEHNLSHYCNNKIIIVKGDFKYKRDPIVKKIKITQYDYSNKLSTLQSNINYNRSGNIYEYMNTQDSDVHNVYQWVLKQ